MGVGEGNMYRNICEQKLLIYVVVVLTQFFEKAAENVKENVGADIQTDQLIKEACRNVLEHVRSLPVNL